MIVKLELAWVRSQCRCVESRELYCAVLGASEEVLLYKRNDHQMAFFGHLELCNCARLGLVHQLHGAKVLSAKLIAFIEPVDDEPDTFLVGLKDFCCLGNCLANISLAAAVFVDSRLDGVVKKPFLVDVDFVFRLGKELENSFQLVRATLVLDHAISIDVQTLLLGEHWREQEVFRTTLEDASLLILLHFVLSHPAELVVAVEGHNNDIIVLS